MAQLKEVLVDELQDLLNAENQLVAALPKMAQAAHCETLKQAFNRHLTQTEGHVERLKNALVLLGDNAGEAKTCKAMKGIIDEGQQRIEESKEYDEISADLALITAAQKAEHYEISGYGNARCIAKQIGQQEVARLLSHTLGEEESADFLLSEVSKPLLERATLAEFGDGNKSPWGEIGDTRVHAQAGQAKAHSAAAGESSYGSKSRKSAGKE